MSILGLIFLAIIFGGCGALAMTFIQIETRAEKAIKDLEKDRENLIEATKNKVSVNEMRNEISLLQDRFQKNTKNMLPTVAHYSRAPLKFTGTDVEVELNKPDSGIGAHLDEVMKQAHGGRA